MSQYPELLSDAMLNRLISGMLSLTFPQNFRRVKIVFFCLLSLKLVSILFLTFLLLLGSMNYQNEPIQLVKNNIQILQLVQLSYI